MENSLNGSFDCGQSRTPLKAMNRPIGSVGSASKADASKPSSYAVGGMDDRLQSRIEHLERERVELSLQLHLRIEKERSKNILIKSLEQAKEELEESTKIAKRDAAFFRTQKETLDMEVGRLNAQLEIQKGKLVASEGLWAKMTAANRETRRLEDEITLIRQESEQFKQQIAMQQRTIESTQVELADAKDAAAAAELSKEAMRTTVDELRSKCTAMDALRWELQEGQSTINELKSAMEQERESFESEKKEMLADIDTMNTKIAALTIALTSATSHASTSGTLVDGDTAKIIAELQEALAASDSKRRKLHNTLQELRGNIRVFVRCRPFLRGDEEIGDGAALVPTNGSAGCIRFGDDGASISVISDKRSASSSGNNFAFDHVFKPETEQADVFNEVSEYVQSALDGYRICIFSYGQTGSGKTHTMTGGRDEFSRGITPRSVEQIIKQTLKMRQQGWDVSLSASMVELYNEDLRDLLISSQAAASAAKDKLRIVYQQGRVTVQGLTAVDIDCSELSAGLRKVQQVLDLAAKHRSTACTNMNDVSSRSHALFMLDIVCRHSDGITTLRGGLRLCDLAGSERLDRTGTLTDAARLKETVNINKSLSCLADVFVALANKGPHIPYRNSKLTLLLQDCLSGDGKSLMIVNVSPTVASSQETVCSLRFASQVSKVELGKAQKCVYVTAPVPAPAPAPVVQPAPVPVAAPAIACDSQVGHSEYRAEREKVSKTITTPMVKSSGSGHSRRSSMSGMSHISAAQSSSSSLMAPTASSSHRQGQSNSTVQFAPSFSVSQPVDISSQQLASSNLPQTDHVEVVDLNTSLTSGTSSASTASSRILSIAHSTGTSASILLQQYRAKRALLQAAAAGTTNATESSTSSVTTTTTSIAPQATGGDLSALQAAKRLRTTSATTIIAATATVLPGSASTSFAPSAAVSAARSWR